jgi:hypothetical protein
MGLKNYTLRIIGQKFILQSNVNFIRQFFYNSKFKPISKRQFVTSEVIRIFNIRHVISR